MHLTRPIVDAARCIAAQIVGLATASAGRGGHRARVPSDSTRRPRSVVRSQPGATSVELCRSGAPSRVRRLIADDRCSGEPIAGGAMSTSMPGQEGPIT
jgi:hypothetical protein